MKKYKIHIVWALVVIVALVGKGIASTGRGTYAGAFGSSTRSRAGGFGGGMGGLVTGEITAMDSSSITLQLPNGNSEVVFYTTSTPVSEPTTVSPSTLTTGTNVMVGGTANSDGSFSATSIQVRPAGSGGFGGGVRTASSSQGG